MHTWEARAREVLAPEVFDFFAGGAGEERTLRASEEFWAGLQLLPHVLRDVSCIDTSTTVLGQPVASPVAIAPSGYQALAHQEGEVAVARAAASRDALLTVSSRASRPLDAVVGAAPNGYRWFQTYVLRDRQRSLDLVLQAKALGFSALVLTVDAPILGRRRRDERNGFSLPPSISSAARSGRPDLQVGQEAQDPSLTFDDIGWLAREAALPVVVKGVLRPDDARQCVASGADAVWVSAHGGRQLDGVVPPGQALAPIVAEVGGDVEVYVDGGVRNGLDVLRAIALGARAVFVGRPVLWGLAVAGVEGVGEVLAELDADLRLSMALSGVTQIGEVSGDLLAPSPRRGS